MSGLYKFYPRLCPKTLYEVRGAVAYDHKERKGFSSTSNHYSMDGTVSKNENAYTIDAQLLGKYVVTLSADGSAILTTPAGSELPLHKSEI